MYNDYAVIIMSDTYVEVFVVTAVNQTEAELLAKAAFPVEMYNNPIVCAFHLPRQTHTARCIYSNDME